MSAKTDKFEQLKNAFSEWGKIDAELTLTSKEAYEETEYHLEANGKVLRIKIRLYAVGYVGNGRAKWQIIAEGLSEDETERVNLSSGNLEDTLDLALGDFQWHAIKNYLTK